MGGKRKLCSQRRGVSAFAFGDFHCCLAMSSVRNDPRVTRLAIVSMLLDLFSCRVVWSCGELKCI